MEDQFSIDLNSPGFKYGVGFFETIAYNGKTICHLDKHLSRIYNSLNTYKLKYQSCDFEKVIQQLIGKNNLNGSWGRINVLYKIENEADICLPLIIASPHTPQPDKLYRLHVSDLIHTSHLAAHKSTNYMHYYLAHRDAEGKGFDDAVLLDQAGNILETTRSAILFQKQGSFIATQTEFKLPSIALQVACEKIDIREEIISKDQLSEFDHVYVLNSLIGIRPVVEIDGINFETEEEVCSKITKLILE